MGKQKYTPTEDELRSIILELAIDGFGPTRDRYDEARPADWISAERIGQKTGVLWSEWVRRCGLKLNNPSRGQNTEWYDPAPRLERWDTGATGIPVREVQRPVMAWNWQRHTYELAGWRRAWTAV